MNMPQFNAEASGKTARVGFVSITLVRIARFGLPFSTVSI